MHAKILVAGTFDHLHKGHEAVLAAAFSHGKQVIVAITSDQFPKTTDRSSYAHRRKEVEAWISKKGFAARAVIIPIHDAYEPAASDAELTALIVTSDNTDQGERINARRKTNGLRKLALIDVPLVPAEDQQKISSTRIRNKDIDREGHLIMPDELRPHLSRPLGKIVAEPQSRAGILISCGDMATKRLIDQGIVPTLAIVDYKVERRVYTEHKQALRKIFGTPRQIISGPGYIAEEAIDILMEWSEDPHPLLMEVEGEEDLLTLSVIQSAPLGSIVYYGQPGVGLVEVAVTAEKKEEVKKLLKQFL